MSSKTLAIIILLFSFLSLCSAQKMVADSAKVDSAKKAAEFWLQLIEQEEYGESWENTAALFKGQVLKEQWINTISSLITAYGKPTSRKFISGKYATSLPGAPRGEYVVIQFNTSFEKKGSSIETITPMKDPDGKWRVSGYFIK